MGLRSFLTSRPPRRLASPPSPLLCCHAPPPFQGTARPVFLNPHASSSMTVTPILTLSGPLTLGPSTGAAGPPAGDGGRAPVAFALPPSLATSSIAYEAHVRGGEAGELEIVARVVSVGWKGRA
jgi:hypothetical protein